MHWSFGVCPSIAEAHWAGAESLLCPGVVLAWTLSSSYQMSEIWSWSRWTFWLFVDWNNRVSMFLCITFVSGSFSTSCLDPQCCKMTNITNKETLDLRHCCFKLESLCQRDRLQPIPDSRIAFWPSGSIAVPSRLLSLIPLSLRSLLFLTQEAQKVNTVCIFQFPYREGNNKFIFVPKKSPVD